jgi:hypothetical protein
LFIFIYDILVILSGARSAQSKDLRLFVLRRHSGAAPPAVILAQPLKSRHSGAARISVLRRCLFWLVILTLSEAEGEESPYLFCLRARLQSLS